MKASGIVRRIDELGRVVIPKEIRKTHPLSGARAVVLFGLVPCRRRSGPRFSGRAGQR